MHYPSTALLINKCHQIALLLQLQNKICLCFYKYHQFTIMEHMLERLIQLSQQLMISMGRVGLMHLYKRKLRHCLIPP
uniref:Uncharacterized protein n=1 Tax=Arundo donax TaxID=35708 RepID=A0A0A9FN13_ARUDO